VALVFDRLSPEARALAYEGALATVSTLTSNDFVGVFLSDLSLATIATYTSDRTRLRDALRDVATRAASDFSRTATKDSHKESSGDAHSSVPVVASAESGGRPVDPVESFLKPIAVGTHNTWEALARDQQGYATTNALMAVVSGLGQLRGRKTVIFFAEGLSIPDAVLPRFRDVVATANRNNVTVYSIDAAGLRVHSKDAEIGREVRGMGLAGITLTPDGSSQSSLGMMERNEDVLRKDPRTSLRLLAEPTGGFLIENTNDLARGLATIDQDRRFHYLVTYTPKDQNFDGRWRNLIVRVPSRQVQVRARTGYVAVRGMSGTPLLAYEAPAIAALESRPLPRQLPLKASALGLLSRSGEPRVAVLVSADASALTFKPNTANDAFSSDFTILARIKDAQGAVVRKASEPYRLGGPIANLERAHAGEILFFRHPELPPGAYMLEAAVHDGFANTAGARFVPFTVHEPGSKGLLVSSLVLVQRTERAERANGEDTDPLITGDLLLYPGLGDPYSRSTDKAVSFFVRLKVPKGVTVPGATLTLLRNGQAATTLPLPLPAPDAQRVIDYTAQLPLVALPVGDFVLRLVVQGVGDEVAREAPLRVVE
jgi:VWFA-related protein